MVDLTTALCIYEYKPAKNYHSIWDVRQFVAENLAPVADAVWAHPGWPQFEDTWGHEDVCEAVAALTDWEDLMPPSVEQVVRHFHARS